MKKQAAPLSPTVRTILGALVGGTAGGVAGYQVTPRMSGYQDVENARRISAVIDAMTGAGLGALTARNPRHLASAFSALPLQAKLGLPAGVAAGELVPVGVASLSRISDSMKDMAKSVKTTGIPHNIRSALTSSTGRGAGAGAALAGIAGIVSGLRRRQTDSEFRSRKTRGSMVASDTMKYMLPSMLAGGIIGSLRKQQKHG